MAKKRLAMKKVREVLRLKFDLSLDNRQIARSLKISHSTVAIHEDFSLHFESIIPQTLVRLQLYKAILDTKKPYCEGFRLGKHFRADLL